MLVQQLLVAIHQVVEGEQPVQVVILMEELPMVLQHLLHATNEHNKDVQLISDSLVNKESKHANKVIGQFVDP